MFNTFVVSSIKISFPDGRESTFDKGISPLEIANSISKSLAKTTLLAKVNGEVWDITRGIDKDSSIELLNRSHKDVVEVIRHDFAHIMAQAVQILFPGTQVTIGPVIENGFFYDFYNEKKTFSQENLNMIEKKMQKIIDANQETIREVWSRDKAIKFFRDIGEYFKVEVIESIPSNEDITVYRHGEFIDLCRGPHLSSTGKVGKAFKLLKVAGAYWKGDSNNPMLQRIYGTAWTTQEELDDHLHILEEAAKRDHRKLGVQMGLFHQQKESPGSVFWHDLGWRLYQNIRNYIRDKVLKNGYIEVNTPCLMDKSFWEKSGHWDKFRDNMFTFESKEKNIIGLKPMNCPSHIQIFNQGIKSYRDLPIRMSEFGSCHRNEPSGALHGLMRVRAFVQDDAHIFCTQEQVIEETKRFCELLKEVYTEFGFGNSFTVKLSDRPEVRVGDDKTWDIAEAVLIQGAEAAGLGFTINKGEGAFYGPKIEFCFV